jgi:hypothetical protein
MLFPAVGKSKISQIGCESSLCHTGSHTVYNDYTVDNYILEARSDFLVIGNTKNYILMIGNNNVVSDNLSECTYIMI